MVSRVMARRLAAAGVMVAMGVTGVAAQGVPGNIEVDAGFVRFFQAHAAGTQNYVCLPTPAGFAWKLQSPTATLFVRIFGAPFQAVTHFLSPNPDEAGLPRATWQHSIDTSRVWAKAIETSSDPLFVDPAAIPWLKLEVVGRQAGPTGGTFLGQAKFIQRINTAGGIAPLTGCSQASDVGTVKLVPYAADYLFFR
jgi:hypothetical protein